MPDDISFPNWLIWDHVREVRTREQLLELHEDLSLHNRLNENSIPVFRALFPASLFILGLVVSLASQRFEDFLYNPTFYVYHLVLLLSVNTIYWFDGAVIGAVISIRSSFAVTNEGYYRLMGELMERLYEPLPYADRPAGRTLHPPTLFAIAFGIVLFIIIPTNMYPGQISLVIGLDWNTLSLGFQVYLVLLLTIAVFIGVTTSWIIFVLAYYMSYRIQAFPVKLDVTRRRDNLGLTSYAQFVLKALGLYLLAYLIASTLIIVRDLNSTLIIGMFLMSLLPLIGFWGSQWGLHQTITASKETRLTELRTEFDTELQQWFLTGEPEPPDTTDTDIAQFVMAKEAIEELPEWPIRVNSVVQLISATFVSNLWIILQFAGLLQ